MNKTYVSEAFKSLSLLNEEDFNLEDTGLEDAKEFINSDEHDETIDIIDPEAENEEELKDEYIGKAICECNVCHSLVYKNPSELVISDDGEMVNEGEECPWCYSSNGFKVVGQVAAFVPEEPKEDEPIEIEAEVEEEPIEEGMEEEFPNPEKHEKIGEHNGVEMFKCNDCGKFAAKINGKKVKKDSQEELEAAIDAMNESLTEEVHEVEVKADGQKVEVKQEEEGELKIEIKKCDEELEEPEIEEPVEAPVEEAPAEEMPVEPGEEVIAPLEPEVQQEIEAEPVEEEPIEEEEPEDMEFDVEDFDEESFDELGEGYLRKVYENVAGFKTTNVKEEGNSLMVEGMIKFTSGNEKATRFMFEAAEATKEGTVRFLGENKHFSRGKKSFALQGRINENRFIAESLNYNYHAKDGDGKAVRLYGTVRRTK